MSSFAILYLTPVRRFILQLEFCFAPDRTADSDRKNELLNEAKAQRQE